MSGAWAQIIFGWPVVLLSLAVTVAGLWMKKPWMAVLGGALCIPFTFYLFVFTYLRYFAFLLPLFQFGAAWAVRAGHRTLAWLLLLPLVGTLVLLAVIVLSQFGS
jgi:hypothetical protein